MSVWDRHHPSPSRFGACKRGGGRAGEGSCRRVLHASLRSPSCESVRTLALGAGARSPFNVSKFRTSVVAAEDGGASNASRRRAKDFTGSRICPRFFGRRAGKSRAAPLLLPRLPDPDPPAHPPHSGFGRTWVAQGSVLGSSAGGWGPSPQGSRAPVRPAALAQVLVLQGRHPAGTPPPPPAPLP